MKNYNLKFKKTWLWTTWTFTTYEITKKYNEYVLLVTTGLINKTTTNLKMFKIVDIEYSRTLGNLICGVGNIRIRTSEGRGGSYITLSKIRDYKKIGEIIEEIAHAERERVKVGYTENNMI